MIYVDTAFLVFSTNLKFDSFFNFKAIKFILVKNISDYAVYSLIRLGYGIVMTIGVICTLGLLFPLLYFVFADLNAQFIRKIFKIQTKQAQG